MGLYLVRFFLLKWLNNEIGSLTLILGLLKRVSHSSIKSLKVTLLPVCSLWLLSVMSSVSINGGWEQVRISIWNTKERQFCHSNFFATNFFKPQTWKLDVSIPWENVKDFVIAFFQYHMYFLTINYEKHHSHKQL